GLSLIGHLHSLIRGDREVEQASFALPGWVKERSHPPQSGSKRRALQKDSWPDRECPHSPHRIVSSKQ
ncbi:hypothetical protein QEH58_20920, partial [Roseibacillus persicicus]|nr:hypothetical protein [Roseibacillus persicicus]